MAVLARVGYTGEWLRNQSFSPASLRLSQSFARTKGWQHIGRQKTAVVTLGKSVEHILQRGPGPAVRPRLSRQ